MKIMTMKRNIFVKGLASLAVAAGLAGCSSDYLEVVPETSVDASSVQTTVEGARSAMYGACRSMYAQYSKLDGYNSFNGESWVSMFYGEVFGQDYFSLLWAARSGSNYTWVNNTSYMGWTCSLAWRYCYNLVNQCNVILDGIDNIEGDKNELDLIKAEALTLRSHAYVRLLQLYAPRWADSREGSRKCIVLRLHSGVEEIPLSTMAEVLTNIYESLDEAIALFEGTSEKTIYCWEPNVDVARGIYARAAMLRNDYPTAEKMAHDARVGHPIMSEAEFLGGFAEANKEWMWCNTSEVEGIYYWAHGSWYACQGPYPTLLPFGAGTINYDLYKQIPAGDIRASQFFTPDKPLRSPLTKSSFWNPNICDPATMNLAKNANMKISISGYGSKMIPGGDKAKWGAPYEPKESGGEEVVIPFGAHFKFWALDNYGSNQFPYMRGAEMLLTEAEAAYMNSKPTVAQNLLKELNAERNSKYTCNLTGDALLKEIKLQRRIELWGEGHSWFDLKRWGDDMVRRPWEAKDNSSNNVPKQYSFTRHSSDMKGWVYAVPNIETQYNHAINRSELD